MHFSCLKHESVFTLVTLAIIYLSYSPTGNAQDYNWILRNVDAFSKGDRCGEHIIPMNQRHKTSKHRVVGGIPIEPGQYPSYVALLSKHLAFKVPFPCAGVIIHKNLVLTSKACAQNMTDISIAAGLTKYEGRLSASDQVRFVDRQCVANLGLVDPPDIVILRVNKSFEYNTKVRAACLDFQLSDIVNPVLVGPISSRNSTQYRTINYIRLVKCPNVDFFEDYMGKFPYSSCFKTIVDTGVACESDIGTGLYVSHEVKEKELQFAVGVLSEIGPFIGEPKCYMTENKGHIVTDVRKTSNVLLEMMYDCLVRRVG